MTVSKDAGGVITPKPKGVACPGCNGPMRVRKTVHRVDRTTQRDRVCLDPKCGYRGTSLERLVATHFPAEH